VLWAALFAGTAGYVDAICYLRLGHAFAANMTGNLVEVGIKAAQGEWWRAGWLAVVLVSFFIAVLLARLVATARPSSRLLLLIEAALIAVAATGRLDGAEIPFLAAAMAIQNQAARHAGFVVNVGFVTGDIQQLGMHLLPRPKPKPEGRPSTLLTVLAFYAIGAGLGTLAATGATMLGVAAAAIAVAALLPERWTGKRHDH
jgi:uncharacterized membrane protein YoaK (UPF0700 family)